MSATETVYSGSIPDWVSPKAIKIGIHSFSTVQQLCGSVKPSPCVVEKWAGGSLTRRPKGPLAVSWPRQLVE